MADRAATVVAFLAAAGWADASRTPLAGDASARRYERLSRTSQTAILMDAPPGTADSTVDFVAIGRHLLSLGLSAPRILAEDHRHGLLLLEDLGDALFARVLQADPARETKLYTLASDVLIRLQSRPAPTGLPCLSSSDWAQSALFALDFYAPANTVEPAQRTAFLAALETALNQFAVGPRVLVLRDFHAENLIWLPDRTGLARAGLLDFQLAQMAHPAFDLVSLLQDARRDVAPETEADMTERFCRKTGASAQDFGTAFATLGALRALRILGVFARLARVSGKPGYLPLCPRVWGHLTRNLEHPALENLAAICARVLPAPTASHLQRIANP
ncbi:MAG: phosphotransferase [Paracoccaceae bacterium]